MLMGKINCNNRNCNCNICRELKDFKMDRTPRIESFISKPLDSTNFILRRAMPFVKRTPSKEWQEATNYDDYETMSTLEDKSRHNFPPCEPIKPVDSYIPPDELINPRPTKTPRTILNNSSLSIDQNKFDYAQPTRPAPPKPLPKPRMQSPDWNQPKIQSDSNNKVVIYFGENKNNDESISLGKISNQSQSSWSLREDESNHDSIENNLSEKLSVDELDDQENSGNCVINPGEIIVNISPNYEDVLRIEEDETCLDEYWSLPGDTTGFKADWSFVQQWRLRG